MYPPLLIYGYSLAETRFFFYKWAGTIAMTEASIRTAYIFFVLSHLHRPVSNFFRRAAKKKTVPSFFLFAVMPNDNGYGG